MYKQKSGLQYINHLWEFCPLTFEKLLHESLIGDFVYYKYIEKGKCAHPTNSCRIGSAHP